MVQPVSTQTLCQNIAATPISVTAYSGPTINYQWYKNTSNFYNGGTAINSANATTLTPSTSAAGTLYYYCVVGGSSCTSNVTSNVSTVIVSPVASGGTILGSTSFCSGTTGVTYSISGVSNATSYIWSVPSGANITGGSGTSQITVSWGSNSGNVYCTPTYNGGCTATGTSIYVNVNLPPPATITPNGTYNLPSGQNVTLTANSGTGLSYQWQNGGVNINGQTYSTYNTSSAGTYTVIVTQNSCSATSSPTTITSGGYITTQSGDWNTPSTWLCDCVPPSGASVTIANSITLSGTVLSTYSITINSGNSLTFGAGGILTVSSNLTNNGSIIMTNGGNLILLNNTTFNNAGTFVSGTPGTGKDFVSFSGNGTATVLGTIAFNNVSIKGSGGNQGVSFSSNSTVNGTLTIYAGGFVNTPPIYAASSLLIYNVGNVYSRYNEWSSSASGQGYPANVEISNNTTFNLGTNNTGASYMSGNLTIDGSCSLIMNNNINQPLTVLGNITNNGVLTLSGTAGGDLYLHGNFINNGSLNTNGRSIGFYGSNPQNSNHNYCYYF